MGRWSRYALVALALLLLAAWVVVPQQLSESEGACHWLGRCPERPAPQPPVVALPEPTKHGATVLERLQQIVPDRLELPQIVEQPDPDGWRRGAVPSYTSLVRQYRDQGFARTEAMPDELRRYFVFQSEEVAAYFGVRPDDIWALLLARAPDHLLRLHPTEDRQDAGIAGLTAEEWNGWSVETDSLYATDLRTIEQQGGVGFDWSYRYLVSAWQEGIAQSRDVQNARATPTTFENSLAAVARLLQRSGITTASAARDPLAHQADLDTLLTPPAAIAPDPAHAPLRAALADRFDRSLGVRPPDARLVPLVDGSPLAVQVAGGTLALDSAADQLFDQFITEAIRSGESAAADGLPLTWPFLRSQEDAAVQRRAVELMGHTLAPWEVAAMAGSVAQVDAAYADSLDAELFSETRSLMEARLQRTARGLPLFNSEVAVLLDDALREVPINSYARASEKAVLLARIEYRLRLTEEYQALYGDRTFTHPPLDPMPTRILKAFGTPASYQPDGIHTGLDLRGSRSGGSEPKLYAMDAGTVVHVGPLYCNQAKKCRGPYAIVISHGNNVYAIYSHNSEAFVAAGDVVEGGQLIGRQGNEGYSRGSHLHLEVHTGAPWSGDWVTPFYGGEFVDPLPWISWRAP